MKKMLLISLALVMVIGIGVFTVQIKTAKANEVTISDINVIVSQPNAVSISWSTNISTTSNVEYGTASGSYGTPVDSGDGTSTSHRVYISDLEYETTYYYRINATDLQNNTAVSDEYTFMTSSQNLKYENVTVIDVGPTRAMISTKTNKSAVGSVSYGTSADNLILSGEVSRNVTSASGLQTFSWIFQELSPSTTYYAQFTATRGEFWHGESESAVSDVVQFTTTGIPSVTSINPDHGPSGIEVTISGVNFGNQTVREHGSGGVGIGCNPSPITIVPGGDCTADIISWSDNRIVVRTNSRSTTGLITVYKLYSITGSYSDFFTIEGPSFRIVGDGQAATNTNTGTVVEYITDAYGCSFSTTTQDDDTIKVSTPFTDGSETDTYLESVYNLYNDNWGRYPRCSEMQFHLDHSTPLDRLANWLAEETIGDKYSCNYSTTLSDATTIRVKSLFTLDSSNDKYLGEVYNAYNDNWGRYPRCSEMQFHLDHATPMARLTSWLEENVPEATTTDVDIPATPADITGAKIEFADSGTTVELADELQSLSFKDTDEITFTGTTTPNSIVTLEIASETAMVVTTRSNSDGHWVYTLPGPLETGDHTVKVAVTDTSGEAISESEEISFKVTSSSSVTSTISDTLEDAGFTTTTWIIIGAAAVVIIILLFVVSKKKSVQAESKK